MKYRLSELGADEQTVAKYNELTLTDWTIPDIIRDAGITHSELKVFIMETDERIEDKEKKLHNAYDLDAIFRAVEEGEINYDADMTHLDRCRYKYRIRQAVCIQRLSEITKQRNKNGTG